MVEPLWFPPYYPKCPLITLHPSPQPNVKNAKKYTYADLYSDILEEIFKNLKRNDLHSCLLIDKKSFTVARKLLIKEFLIDLGCLGLHKSASPLLDAAGSSEIMPLGQLGPYRKRNKVQPDSPIIPKSKKTAAKQRVAKAASILKKGKGSEEFTKQKPIPVQ